MFLRLSASVLLVAGTAVGQYIPMAKFARTYNDSRGYPRGFIGQAPVDFFITGIKVFNEAKNAQQTVSVMELPTKPPAYPSSHAVVAAELKFFKKNTPANTLIPVKPPVKITKGKWFGVLGVTHGTAQTVSSSYSVTGGFTTSVLGQKMAIERLLMQAIVRTNNGLGGVATEGTGTGPMGRVEVHVAGQGPIPLAVDYGAGSTTKPIGPKNPYMPIPAFARTYNDTRGYPRGFFFQSPTTFVVNGLRVPNEATNSHQTVALYLMSAKPPAFPSQVVPKPTELKFFKKDQLKDTLIKVVPPVPVKPGDWVCVLGSTHGTTTTMSSSYGNGPFKSSVLSQPVTIERLISQNVIRNNNGLGGIASSSGSIGRVQLHILGQGGHGTLFPEQTTVGLPGIGQAPKLDIKGKIPGAQVGAIFLSNKRLPKLPTPLGNLLIALPVQMIAAVPGGTGQYAAAIPNDKVFFNVTVDWQTFIFNFTTSTFGSTNGTEWRVGQ